VSNLVLEVLVLRRLEAFLLLHLLRRSMARRDEARMLKSTIAVVRVGLLMVLIRGKDRRILDFACIGVAPTPLFMER
jgi:hypothetical protein